MAKRAAEFDIMKGIGILLVITAHFFGWNHPWLSRGINSFHMPMFFIVAGYFSKSFVNWPDVWSNIKKYACRLLPAYIFTQLFIVGWCILTALFLGGEWSDVIRESLSLVWGDVKGPATPWGNLSIGVIWFLIALFVAKSILQVISKYNGWAIPISFALSIGALLLYKVLPYSIWSISMGLIALPFVTIGWWVRNHEIPLWLKITLVLCWIAAIIFSTMNMYEYEWRFYPLDVLGACGGTYCLYLISKWISDHFKFTTKSFAYLGICSLAIMCFHDIEMYCHLGNHVIALFPVSFPEWAYYIFRYVLTVALAMIAIKTPIIKRLFT